MRNRVRAVELLGAAWLLLAEAPAGAVDPDRQWPSWRGPHQDGVAPHADPPRRWSETENVRFKVAIPGRGLASPVVWGDKVFLLTTVTSDTAAYAASQEAAREVVARRQWPPAVAPVAQRFVVLALSRADGRVLWERTATERLPHESHHLDSSWASASPVTDGRRLVAHFGSHGTFAYDLHGNLLWQTDLGDMTTRRGFGEGSSPVLHGDTVIINWDHEGDSFLVALDAASGEPRWKTPRPGEISSWSTPLVVAGPDGTQVVVAATGKSRGYDLATGEERWRLGGMTVNTVPSPVHRHGVVYLTSGFRGTVLQAVDLAQARGEVEGTPALLWTHSRHTPYVPSPLLYGDQLYFLKHFQNILTSLDADSGEVLFTEQRLPGLHNVYASPVGAASRVYVFDRDGHAVVLRHGRHPAVVAENTLAEGAEATPALVDGEIYLRTHHHLYCLAEQGPEAIRPRSDARPPAADPPPPAP